jgi:catechol 2,3-dioxygenase-like lactoylglutathione lyase family enzyme
LTPFFNAGTQDKVRRNKEDAPMMKEYVHPGEQLVVVLYVRDIKKSGEFFKTFGFTLVRDEGSFMELRWESSLLFLEEREDGPAAGSYPVGNIRVMVPNVDDFWALAQRLGVAVANPIGDRYYGLRDFVVMAPDGLNLRFATRLSDLRK